MSFTDESTENYGVIKGRDGTAWLTGITAPSADMGKEGDLYFDSLTCDIYSKNGGVWILISNIKGEKGDAGRGIRNISIVDGDLIVFFSDNTQVNLGSVRDVLGEQEYIVAFVADGIVVETVTYTAEDKNIVEPTVPYKKGYIGQWEEYTLTVGDRTVEAIYSPNKYTLTLKLEGNYGELVGANAYFSVGMTAKHLFPKKKSIALLCRHTMPSIRLNSEYVLIWSRLNILPDRIIA